MATDFKALVERADAAGRAAADRITPTPMVVSGHGQTWYVPQGACGFAWVSFAGNTAFGRWAKQQGLTRPGYPKGLMIWVSQYNQSVDLKEAYAHGFAAVLRAEGIDAWGCSRLD